MGTAVDNEEVTTNSRDILEDKTNFGSPKSDYGGAIQEELVRFYNLYNPKDNVFEQIYPLLEGDLALGQSGAQKVPYAIRIPTNFDDIKVTGEIEPIRDADGIEADVFGLCNNNNDYCTIKNEGWEDLTKVAQWVDQNNIRVNVEREFSLDEAGEALGYQKNEHPRGKVVLAV